MSIGLTNAPDAFIDHMNSVFHEYLNYFVIVFIDDIFIYTKTIEEHEQFLGITLQVLREHQLYAKLSKCEFWLRAVTFLGHVVSDQDVKVHPKKIESVKNWLRPLTPIDMWSLFSLASNIPRSLRVFPL